MQTLKLDTKHKTQMIEISNDVKEAVIRSGVKNGICTIMTPHTTASILLFENQDPNLTRDFLKELSRWIPTSKGYSHKGDNAHAHIKSGIIGGSTSIMVQNGQPLLGQWQGLFFAEFDGPREGREYYITVVNG